MALNFSFRMHFQAHNIRQTVTNEITLLIIIVQYVNILDLSGS